MCGIVGAVAKRPIASILIDGLKKLEYRGYDSAGVAVIDQQDRLHRLRMTGKVRELETAFEAHPFQGPTGIAHTRWATHGVPSEANAHPFISHDEFAIVHNGIIENHNAIRADLITKGYQFHSETDTEVVVHLIHWHFKKDNDLLSAVRNTVNALEGAYALGVIAKRFPGRLIAVRQGSPLVIGKGKEENFIASDPLALLSLTKQFIYLEDHDVADITANEVTIFNKADDLITREQHILSIDTDITERGQYRHYMQKEIMEQPKAIADCLEGRLAVDHILPAIFGPKADAIFEAMEHMQLIACGTSYHAALVARYWFENILDIPCSVEIASEFRYRPIAQPKQSLFVTLSQSGETADTLAALRLAKKMEFLGTLTLCNVPGSTMTREADLHFLTRAGIEIGVASTKAFTTQLIALLLLGLSIARAKGKKIPEENELIAQLHQLPALISQILQQDAFIADWAKAFMYKQNALFMARGSLFPIALEGALKMKEISYIHAEGYPSGELKHGPLALVDKNMPVITAVPSDRLQEKSLSNLHEVLARGGQLFVLTDLINLTKDHAFADVQVFQLPTAHPLLHPIIYTIPLQMLAYHVAVLKGTDVDQPRNLAKSVTVE
ncbi:MAG: glutamine--fructose-6-phosphate transaminase (isomerizing) [Gammaproteobacteria bacterium]|nr:glutamine--fructose-6-phosphate transaminase (isomerizing) [Gammaproteobacteria bacterium]